MGRTVKDPTANVLDLVQAAIQRQDDLREMQAAGLRREMEMFARFTEQLRVAETQRIDAIRAVDVAATRRDAEVAELRAATLQAQVAAAAEAMRTTVAATAQTSAEGLANAIKPLADALAAVQQAQNISAGQKVQVAESRGDRGEARLNLGAVFGGVSILLVLIFGVLGLVLANA